MNAARPDDQRAFAFQIVLFAAASLYFELAFIRFASAEVLYLGYFSNFLLISAFVGLGLGFLSAKGRVELLAYMPSAMVFLCAFVLLAGFDVSFLGNHFGLFFFGSGRRGGGLPGPVLLPVLFVVTVAIFAAFGQCLGKLFPRFAPLRAYTLDITGSLLGIGLFTIQSQLESSPVTWLATGGFLLVAALLADPARAMLRPAVHVVVAVAGSILLIASASPTTEEIWSPYQKLEYQQDEAGTGRILANNVLHQFLQPADRTAHSYYAAPYRVQVEHGGSLDRVLIVGAGSGTDVAAALHAGARHVDAVEIDPGILALGVAHHVNRPYRDLRVRAIVEDGRAFLQRSTDRYDLIIFALPDSVVLASPMSSVRLESHLFTVEAFESAKAHLRPNGAFVLYNQYRWPWLRNRIASTLAQVFGRPPMRLELGSTTVLAAGARLPAGPSDRSGFDGLATDDWPFVYMQQRGVHWLYIGMIAMFFLAAIGGVAAFAPRGALRRPDWAFFALGVAFLLLETKSLSLFALLFGSTWTVNALAFIGVLSSVLLANLVVQRAGSWRRAVPRPVLLGLLFGSLAAAYLCPASVLLGIGSSPVRFVAAAALVFSPIFAANLLFSREFASSDESARAFGWNILGAVVGGGLEYLSLLVGYRNLLVLVALCYVVAALALRRHDAVVAARSPAPP